MLRHCSCIAAWLCKINETKQLLAGHRTACTWGTQTLRRGLELDMVWSVVIFPSRMHGVILLQAKIQTGVAYF